MTWLDYTLIGVLLVSIAWGVWRGLVREAISLAGWVVAFLVANLLAAPLVELLPKSLPRPEWHLPLAFGRAGPHARRVVRLGARLVHCARIGAASGLDYASFVPHMEGIP